MTESDKIRERLALDFTYYAPRCLMIRTKEGTVEYFTLNKAQKYIHQRLSEQIGKTGFARALILKGRQQGCSTYVGGRFYHKTIHSFGTQCFILTHALDATSNLYKMAQRFYQNTPEIIKPNILTNNSKELIFSEIDSGYKIGTAENKAVGRSSTIQLFHGSEVAFWANASEHAKGIMQAVPNAPGTEIILESTANGVGNYFHQMWQKAEANQSDFIAIFVPWFWQDEYRRELPDNFQLTNEELEIKSLYGLDDEQMSWRRYKIVDLSLNGQDGEKSFAQEYPCNPTEAFQLTGENTYIQSSMVAHARIADAEAFGPLVMACDPARFGDDRTSIILRQGRKAFGLQSYSKKTNMEIAGILYNLIEYHKPVKIFIDMGGGAGIVDRLHELLPSRKEDIVGVNFGGSPIDSKRYANKRAEMWGECLKWLSDEPCQIPDSDSLHADLCSPRYHFDSNSRLLMEKKEDMKKRGIRSPDEADALCLTFAFPVSAYMPPKSKSNVLKALAQDFSSKMNAIDRARK